ncbi:hypothetical protein Cni_G25763 [Canna indica]|uniref:X8 domain-containing protein n=1 Tax=Canna indica TaxID=4628 RepID=A0AAQ3KYK7_9LILI|nr:hypothetical protein Cni_G25763 [Canna indica]
MAALVLLILAVSMFGVSDAAWCVCKPDASTTALQKTLDYACGAGADCNPILQVGACYNPNTVLAHCSYAANSYYQRNSQAQTACDFSGTAMLTSTDPSSSGCVYPATPSAAGTSTAPPSTGTTPSLGTPTSFSPTTNNTMNGVLGGLGPTGTSTGMEASDGGDQILRRKKEDSFSEWFELEADECDQRFGLENSIMEHNHLVARSCLVHSTAIHGSGDGSSIAEMLLVFAS